MNDPGWQGEPRWGQRTVTKAGLSAGERRGIDGAEAPASGWGEPGDRVPFRGAARGAARANLH
jgi:hypothetical protein